jgi:hypothetical protein
VSSIFFQFWQANEKVTFFAISKLALCAAAVSKFQYPLLRAKIHGAPLLRVVLSARRCENQK